MEKIDANLNFDMISRNDPNMIYLIGSNKLSSELDAAIHWADDRSVRIKLDYTYESPAHPDQFFFRSDQYPYIRYGIPGVWFFCGTDPDLSYGRGYLRENGPGQSRTGSQARFMIAGYRQ